MKKLAIILALIAGTGLWAFGGQSFRAMPHEMQHGFILAANDQFASHLVASGHHSWQTEIKGELFIEDPVERETYMQRKALNKTGSSYFLFQAQKLNLPSVSAGQILTGHIVESTSGKYEPKNIIVQKASFKVIDVILSLENPFFGAE